MHTPNIGPTSMATRFRSRKRRNVGKIRSQTRMLQLEALEERAMLTADLASRQSGVKALMLLSGPPSEGAVAHMAATPELAVFVAAAKGDMVVKGVADTLQRAAEGSNHPHSTAKIYEGTEHVLPMFDKHADLKPALVAWLKTELLGN